ncbi:MAG TPA: hypothetical protein VFN75_10970 [Pseudonocardiaceae bacterium]|nr:hypothetical protein [Pseudonocardiaceae bacterium]
MRAGGPEGPAEESEQPLADQAVCYPTHLAGPQRPKTPSGSVDTRPEQWIQDNRLRINLAVPRRLQLRWFPHRDAGGRGAAAYEITPARNTATSYHGDVPVSTTDRTTIDEVEKYLVEGATRAEVIEYLGDTYGQVFVADLIKHLHNPPCRSAS